MSEIRTLKAVKNITVEADAFINMIESRRDNIESTRFIPPKIGEESFGEFKITFRDKELMDV